MPRRKSQGCLGLIFLGAVVYSCISSSLGSFSNRPANERNDQAITASRSSGPRVVLPTATRVAEPANVIAALPTPTPTEVTSPDPPEGSAVWGVVTASVLNVREAPGTDARIVGTLAAGECVELQSEVEGWYTVATESIAGWSSSDYITVVTACPTEPGVAQAVPTEPVANEPIARDSQVAVATNGVPNYVGQPFAPNAVTARDGWFHECFGQGDKGLRAVGAGTPVQLLGVGDFVSPAEQQAMLGRGPFYKIRIWDGQFGWLPTALMDTDPLAYGRVPGACAEYDTIDWTVVRSEPTAAPLPAWVPAVVAPPTSAAPSWTPNPTPVPSRSCCKICTKGKACGDSCISRSYTCRKGPGCACNG